MRFLRNTDYSHLIREELLALMDGTLDNKVLIRAEDTALAQIGNYIGGRYDIASILAPVAQGEPDTRDPWIVTVAIDLTLYHLWTKEREKVPQERATRYEDAITWLKEVGKGLIPSQLPPIASENYTGEVRLFSLHAPNDHKY